MGVLNDNRTVRGGPTAERGNLSDNRGRAQFENRDSSPVTRRRRRAKVRGGAGGIAEALGGGEDEDRWREHKWA